MGYVLRGRTHFVELYREGEFGKDMVTHIYEFVKEKNKNKNLRSQA